MPTLATLAERAGAVGLAPLGGFHPAPGDRAPAGTGTLVLLGPDGAGFWSAFRASSEFGDGAAHLLDRWSARVIGGLAAELDATAVFPFGGPPWAPFHAWARQSGEAWESPVGLLVHARLGLFVSYRGALAFRGRLALPPAVRRPCDSCARPCLTACPVGALGGGGYAVDACHRFLDSVPGQDCLGRGCLVRRACPVGAGLRPEAQSGFHMTDFHGKRSGCDA